MSNKLNIAYLEYLDTREELDYFKNLFVDSNNGLFKNVNLYLISNLATENDIQELMQYFNKVDFFNTSKDFDFSQIQLCIVPATYKENISQSAINFAKNKVAILCGNQGGECEFSKDKIFTFDTDNKADFIEKLLNFANNQSLIDSYFENMDEIAIQFLEELEEVTI